jgi:hypothetical protein
MQGESWAVLEIGNRMDGKVAQPIGGDPDGEAIKQAITIVTGVPRGKETKD